MRCGAALRWAARSRRALGPETALVSGGAQSRTGFTPLLIALNANRPIMAELLLGLKADPSGSSKDGATPLHIAARKGYQSMAELVHEHGGDLDAADNVRDVRHCHAVAVTSCANVTQRGQTPLHHAAVTGRTRTVETLCQLGAHADPKDSVSCCPPVPQYMNECADGDSAAQNGETPARLAVGACHVGTVRVLLSHGAQLDVNRPFSPVIPSRLRRMWMPLLDAALLTRYRRHAAQGGQLLLMKAKTLEMMRILVDAGGDLAARNQVSNTHAAFAARCDMLTWPEQRGETLVEVAARSGPGAVAALREAAVRCVWLVSGRCRRVHRANVICVLPSLPLQAYFHKKCVIAVAQSALAVVGLPEIVADYLVDSAEQQHQPKRQRVE
jgi:hypothetical protein